MKGFRSHHPPSLDFSWRNVRNPAQNRPLALQKRLGHQGRTCRPDCDRVSIGPWEIADATTGVHCWPRQHGGVAARSAGAAGRPRAAHRRARGALATAALQRETRTIPIVFAGVSDPVVSGIVPRLDRPSGNVTGFAIYEASLGGKWLELLSEIAPGLKRAAIMFNPDTTPVSVYTPSLETAARSLMVVPIIAPVHSDVEIEAAIIALGREAGGGLVVLSDSFTAAHRASIISSAARNDVPAVYGLSYFARDGGLLSYGFDPVDTLRGAATYVDRILRGAKPGDLPVQFPTKFEMAVNLKTAKALGLAVPQSILLSADEVIE
jgi:putative tryptophan/tyrosine transport system substrate-binding protein